MLLSDSLPDYPNGNITFTSQQTGPKQISGYETVSFLKTYAYDLSDSGAIYNYSTFTLSDNRAVTFSGKVSYGGAIYNDRNATFTMRGNESVTFSQNRIVSGHIYDGGAICNDGTFTLNGNGDITFSGNTANDGGAIYNDNGTFTLNGNGDVTFSGNASSDLGGAIYHYNYHNDATFTLSDNRAVTFSGNASSDHGGAIANCGPFTMSGNEAVTFSGNTASASGGAIMNHGIFILRDNGNVTFSGNASSYHYHGGAIWNYYTFTLSDNGDVTFCDNEAGEGGAIYNDGTFTMRGNRAVSFSENSSSCGGAIYNNNYFTMLENEAVTFSGNTASAGGAIYNERGTFTLRGNRAVSFSENSSSYGGGAIKNDYYGTFTMLENETVTFSGNTASAGGAIANADTFTMSGNEVVTFSGNTASTGGAIENYGTFTMSGNGDITFSGNSASGNGGAIYNYTCYCDATFTLSGNGNVLFEKNAEVSNGTYRLRSIYSSYYTLDSVPTLNLSASEGKSILFRDSVYASGTVNLNQDGTGDIIFSGVSTEADLREVKGGIDGTAEEILNSRTSEIATNASLYGGRLIVEDGAILIGQGITVTEGANATIRLNGGTLDETGYAIAVSSGSGLEFEGENTLAASAVSLADNSFLNFILDEAQTAVNWDANLDIQGGLTLNLTHEDKPVHETYALLAMQSGNTVTGWDAANLSISGASAEHLAWENNTLYYRPMLVQENGDTTLDKDVETEAAGGAIGGKDDVSIDGNGHALTVKNAVQLVQMALKDGTVKLEGENNGIVSVTLTEGGELVLTAGAGLKTGDIISMVASGKGELVISGDITLDDKGMKGHNGNLATVSHADMKVLGDASISNVRVEDSAIDLLEGSTVNFTNVVLAATARITDDPATANMDCVVAELAMGVNTWQTGSGAELTEGTVLTQTGNTGETLTLTGDSPVLMLEATTFDSLTLTGTTLTLSLSGMTQEEFDAASVIGISFTSGKDYAVFDSSLAVLLTLDGGITFTPGYTLGGNGTTVYFCKADAPVVPEPATATLSLLALAALAARRRRPLHKVH